MCVGCGGEDECEGHVKRDCENYGTNSTYVGCVLDVEVKTNAKVMSRPTPMGLKISELRTVNEIRTRQVQ
jgi:hypothetical protein